MSDRAERVIRNKAIAVYPTVARTFLLISLKERTEVSFSRSYLWNADDFVNSEGSPEWSLPHSSPPSSNPKNGFSVYDMLIHMAPAWVWSRQKGGKYRPPEQ